MNTRGVTLVEVLVTAVLIAVVAVLIGTAFARYNERQLLVGTRSNILALLDNAREQTLASKNASQYGVYFAADRAVLFQGTTYATGTPTNVEFLLPPRVRISVISLAGGGTSAIFTRLSGETNQYGTLTVSLTRMPLVTADVIIPQTGVAQ